MAILGDERRISDYMRRKLETGVTRQAFAAAFRNYLPAVHLLPKVGKKRMRWFFKIAGEFLRLRVAAKEAKRLRMMQDYRRGEALIEGTRKRMTELLAFLQKFPTVGRGRTPAVARFISEAITSTQKKLGESLNDTFEDIARQKAHLQNLRRKTEVYEFIIDLRRLISDQFPTMKEKDKEALIGAALAGVKLFTDKELLSDPQERVHRKVFLAMRYYKKQYQDTGVERAFPVLKKPESGVRRKKKQGGGARKRVKQ